MSKKTTFPCTKHTLGKVFITSVVMKIAKGILNSTLEKMTGNGRKKSQA